MAISSNLTLELLNQPFLLEKRIELLKAIKQTGSINKAAAATKADLTVGQRVAVFGTTNTDGSVTAANVQLNPMMRGPGGPSGATGAQGAM